MFQTSSSVAEAGTRSGPCTKLTFALLLLLSPLLLVDEALASEPSTPLAAPGVSAAEEQPLLARRRARQRRPRQQPRKQATPPAEAPAPAPAPPAAHGAADSPTRRGPTRVEFDERLLQGQTNKANAIYLFQRRESALRSLVKKREHFHAEIDEALE